MAQSLYPTGKLRMVEEGLGPMTDGDYGLLLVHSTYAYSAAHEFVADVATHELNGGTIANYARKPLTGMDLALDGSTVRLVANLVTYDDVAAGHGSPWPEIDAGIIYRNVTDDTDSWLFAFLDGLTATTNGDDLIVSWSTSGILWL